MIRDDFNCGANRIALDTSLLYQAAASLAKPGSILWISALAMVRSISAALFVG